MADPVQPADLQRLSGDHELAAKPRSSVAPLVLFLVVIIGLTIRAAVLMNEPGNPDYREWVMQDFRDATYYPVVSFLSGDNPYDAPEYLASYPVRQTFSPYSPLYLLVHVPFGLLPHGASQWLFFALGVGLTIGLGYMILRWCARTPSVAAVLGLAALIFASRPGHWNLLVGQPTLEFVFAVYVALRMGAKSPWAGGVALAAATMKPTFGVPLAVLMLAQRSYASVLAGTGIAAIVTLVPTIILINSAGGFVPFFESVWNSYAEFGHTVSDSPLLCPTRVDAVVVVGRILGRPPSPAVEVGVFALLIGLATAAVRRVSTVANDWRGSVYTISLASVAILVAVYHQGYCALLLALPLTALGLNCWAPSQISASRSTRTALILLLSIPAVNYLASFSASEALGAGSAVWHLLTSVNSFALLTAFAIYVALALRIGTGVPTAIPADPSGTNDQREPGS